MREYIKLCDVCDFQGGSQPPKNEWSFDLKDGYIRMLQIRDFTQSERVAPEYIKITKATKICEVDDILIARYGASLGKVLTGLAGAYNVAIMKTIPDTNVLEKKYLYYYLKSPIFQGFLLNVGSRAAQAGFNKNDLQDLLIPNITRNEQVEIVGTLERVETVIEARQNELQKLDDLIKARFVEMFGDPEENPFNWEKTLLTKVIINANNGMARRGNDKDGNIVMRLVELQDGYIDYSNPNRIILKDNEKKRYLLKDKDFLFARVNGNPDNVGRCAVFHDIGEDVYHNDHIIRVHFDEELLNGTFASALFNSDYGKKQLKSQIKTSAGQYTVSQDGIGAIATILPPAKLQNQFADFVHQVDKSKLAVQKSLDKTQQLFDSLMQEYFG